MEIDEFESRLSRLNKSYERVSKRTDALRQQIRDHFKHCPHNHTGYKTESMPGGYLDRSWERKDFVCWTCNKVLKTGETHYGGYA